MNTSPSGTAGPSLSRDALRPDCSNCFALCCTAFGFTRSADFAIDKPPASPCPNLANDFSCSIHDRLRPRGFRGCTIFDCFGAGQAVSQGLFGGVGWRTDPGSSAAMFTAFKVVKHLHEMLWHLAEAKDRTFSQDIAAEVQALQVEVEAAARQPEDSGLEDLHARTRELLRTVSEEVRAGYFASDGGPVTRLQPGADLAGARLQGLRLCGADLRGAVLIAADLRGADLTAVDLLGADLRDARLDDADLSRALFLTQAQITSALGNGDSLLPRGLSRPAHWVQEAGPAVVRARP